LSPVDLRAFAGLMATGLDRIDGEIRHLDGSALTAREADLLGRASLADLEAGKLLLTEDVLHAQIDHDAHEAFANLVGPVIRDGEDWADAVKRLPPEERRRAWDLAVAAGYAERV